MNWERLAWWLLIVHLINGILLLDVALWIALFGGGS